MSLTLAWLLDHALNRALAFAIVGVLYAGGAAALLIAGRKQAKLISPVPK